MDLKAFFSFDYARDVTRVARIREDIGCATASAAGFRDALAWDAARREGDAAVQALIDTALHATSITIVCIGAGAGDRHVDYAIERSIGRGNGIIGLRIHAVPDAEGRVDREGPVPRLLSENWYDIHTYMDARRLATWIEAAAREAPRNAHAP